MGQEAFKSAGYYEESKTISFIEGLLRAGRELLPTDPSVLSFTFVSGIVNP